MQQSCVPMAGQSSAVTWECDSLAHRFGTAADNELRQPRYPTDMTDGEGPLGFFTDANGPASPLVSTAWIPPGPDFDPLRVRAEGLSVLSHTPVRLPPDH